MSSGFGLDDFYALADFAVGVYKQCRDCPGQYRSLASQTRQLSSILEDLSDLSKSGKIDASKEAELLECAEGCRDVLDDLDTQLKKYNGLSTQSKRTWDRLGWDQQGAQDLRDVIKGNVTALNNFYDTLLSSSQVKIQEALDQLMTDYQGGYRDASGVSTLVPVDEDEDGDCGDEDVAWPQIIKDLKDLGISEELAAEHRTLIVDWFLKAINDSLLQEKAPEESDPNRPIWTVHESDLVDLVPQHDGNNLASPEGVGSPQMSTPEAEAGTPDRKLSDTEPDDVADKLRALDVKLDQSFNHDEAQRDYTPEIEPPHREPPQIPVAAPVDVEFEGSTNDSDVQQDSPSKIDPHTEPPRREPPQIPDSGPPDIKVEPPRSDQDHPQIEPPQIPVSGPPDVKVEAPPSDHGVEQYSSPKINPPQIEPPQIPVSDPPNVKIEHPPNDQGVQRYSAPIIESPRVAGASPPEVKVGPPTNDSNHQEYPFPKPEPPRRKSLPRKPLRRDSTQTPGGVPLESEFPEVVACSRFNTVLHNPPRSPRNSRYDDAGLEVFYQKTAEPEFGTPGLETPPPLPPKAKIGDAGLELAPGPPAPVSGLEAVNWDMNSGLELAPGPPAPVAGLEPAPGPEVATCDPEPIPRFPPPYEDDDLGFEIANGPELVTSDVDPTSVVDTNMVWTAQLIVEHWNMREWHEADKHIAHQITAVQEGQYIEIKGIRCQPDIRLLTHLLGVSASFRGEFEKAKNLFESVMRTPFTSGEYLDEGDIVAAHWLGDTCVCLNQPENAALAYSIAILGLYLRQPNNPGRTTRVIGELRQYDQALSGLSNLQRTFQRRNVDGSTILSTTHTANKLRLVNWCQQQIAAAPYGTGINTYRRRPFISMDIVEGFLTRPLIDQRSWPLPYDPFFIPQNAAQASQILAKKSVVLEARVPTTAIGNSKKLAYATRRDFPWFVATLRRALSNHAIEYVERESGFVCRLAQYHHGFSYHDFVQIRLRKLPLRSLWGFKVSTMSMNTRNPMAPNFYDTEAAGIESRVSELLRNFCEDAERGEI